MHEHAYPIKIPVFPVNDMLRSTTKNTIQADGARQVGYNAVLYKFWDLRICRFTSYQTSISHLKHPRDLQLDGIERRVGHSEEDPRQC